MSYEENESRPPLEVPKEAISDEALRGIIENFIQREGTDYGREEVAFETKFNQIRKQIDKGDVKIVFDPNTESVGLMNTRDWQKLQKS
ncbi:hypothetical protein AZI87_10030 [Bdellovibrio bacteriovorus]|uniref:YheU family protein n=1 Tax=Bdellovibrio bacteriovorus TaxID=959 RepID=A0A162H2I2_BDEBC|nr:YheU family protein [Bdellovibrio bacteriovorus]KYG69507.1 hypothetical protein AZI87_10030 [Bdellovibrio bacteriovorus]